MKLIKYSIIAILLLFGTNCVAAERSPLQSNPEQWHFIISPYAWLMGMHGSMTVKGNTTQIDMRPIELFNLLSDLDFFGELHFEASRGNWAFMIDPTYIKLTVDSTVESISATVSPEIWLIDFGVFYRVNQLLWKDASSNSPTIQAFVGGRHMSIENTITLSGSDPIAERRFNAKQSWISPIVGARIFGQVSQNWTLSLRGDIGGFGVDNNSLTWTIVGLAHYAINKHLFLSLGIRALRENYSVGTGSTRFAFYNTMYGPLIGLTWA